MPIMEWNKDFETGVDQFDEHHKHFISLINRVCDDMDDGTGHEALGATLDELIDYAAYHFAAEEQWMGAHDYPGLKQQREEHAKFTGEIVEIQKEFQSGKMCLSLEVLQLLVEWLTDHILNIDAEYGRFAAKHPDSE